jgi:2-dehydropantoate 2-reductase
MINKIAVVGFGGVGALLTALLLESGRNVITLVRENSLSQYLDKVQVVQREGGDDLNFKPQIACQLNEPVDLIFLAIKYAGLDDLIQVLPPELTTNTLIVPLLNGFSHYKFLKDTYRNAVIATSTIGKTQVLRKDHTTISLKTPSAKISLSEESVNNLALLNDFKSICQEVDVECEIKNSNDAVIWEKYSRICVLATLTAAAQMSLGEIKKNMPLNNKMLLLTKEVAAISTAYGYAISSDELLARIDRLPDHQTSSLQRDIAVGKSGELDVLVGNVIALAENKHLHCDELKKNFEIINTHLDMMVSS